MLNQVLLVGRICQEIKVKNLEEGRKVTIITLAVQREFKNHEGLYDVDFIKITAWDHLANIALNYCSKGQMCAVKARIIVNKYPLTEDKKLNILELVAEKIISISPNKLVDIVPKDEEVNDFFDENDQEIDD